jgi:hypothetical protein
MKKNVSRLPALVGYDWLEQEAGTQPAVLRLVRVGFQDGGTNTGNDLRPNAGVPQLRPILATLPPHCATHGGGGVEMGN